MSNFNLHIRGALGNIFATAHDGYIPQKHSKHSVAPSHEFSLPDAAQNGNAKPATARLSQHINRKLLS